MHTYGKSTRRFVVSMLLLASMLFYVSGAALGLHQELEHQSNTDNVKACIVDCSNEHSDPTSTPTPSTHNTIVSCATCSPG